MFDKRKLVYHLYFICLKTHCYSSTVEVIYQKRVRVFHLGFQTPRNR